MMGHSTVRRWLTGMRAGLAAVATSLTAFGLALLLRRVDEAVPPARDPILCLLGVALVIAAVALEPAKWPDEAPGAAPVERLAWHECDGSFLGMAG